MNTEQRLEEGSLSASLELDTQKAMATKRQIQWWILALNIAFAVVGTIGGPMLIRLYYLHGGSRKWTASWLQTAGFPLLLVPLSVLYCHSRATGGRFWAEPRLMAASAAVGLLLGADNFMYSLGLSYLPVSTSSLLFSTQLAFTAFFAFIIVKQRFTPFSVNAVVLMTLGAVLLGIRQSGDRPANVTGGQYFLGFIVTLGAAGLLGFLLPCIETAYTKVSKSTTFTTVLQFQLGSAFVSTVFCTAGMLINGDFAAMPADARAYGLGEGKFYLVLAATAVAFQFLFIGLMGVVYCTSSLFSGVLTATLLPMTQIAGVVFYKEKFTGEKGMALALCLWGFTSYFYGTHRANKKQKQLAKEEEDDLH